MTAALALLAGGAFAYLSTLFPVGDSDVFWHLVTARDIAARGLGAPDAMSWTAAGAPVATDQWLGQVLLGWAYETMGWRGVVAFRALGAGALVALAAYAALLARPGRPLLALLAALPALLLTRFISTERPQLFGFVCFALLVVLLHRARAGGPRALGWAIPLTLVWANLHGSFALGVVLVALVCAEGALSTPRAWRGYLAVAAGVAGAGLLTPAGLGSWTVPGLHLTAPPREIQEWAVPDPRTAPGALFAIAFAMTAFAALRRPASRADLVLLLPLFLLGLTAQRQVPFFAIAAAPFVAERLPALRDSLRSVTSAVRMSGGPLGGAPPRALALLFAAAGLAMPLAGILAAPERPNLEDYPAGAVASLRPGPGLFNHYDWGGYLAFAVPATPVFIDGRLTPFLSGVIEDYRTVVSARPGWRDVVARRGIRQLLVRPRDPIAVRTRELGWRIAAAGSGFVLIDVP